eukprot:1411000-Lingulodinium_polyedra.AAC.1
MACVTGRRRRPGRRRIGLGARGRGRGYGGLRRVYRRSRVGLARSFRQDPVAHGARSFAARGGP